MLKAYHIGTSADRGIETIHRPMKENPKLLLVDTRKDPFSWQAGFNWYELKKRYGKRYRKAGDWLGNKNHKNKDLPIEIVNLEEGIKTLISFLEKDYDLLLMCQCPTLSGCHMKHVLASLVTIWPLVEAIDPLADTVGQPSTF